MLNHLDWTETDLEALPPDAIPATSYKPRGEEAKYAASYTHWRSESENSVVPARDHYRLAWRNMAANTGERTFIPAVIPPGTAHIHGVSAVGLPDDDVTLAVAAAFASSLVHDFAVRSAPKSTISASTLNRLPFVDDDALRPLILLRSLRLNCVTAAYSALWHRCFDAAFGLDAWTGSRSGGHGRDALGDVVEKWTPDIVLRRSADRRQALLELDVLVGMALGVDVEELCTIYRTQFPVLYGYDRKSQFYDANGRLVPTDVASQWQRQEAAGRTNTEPLHAEHPGSGVEYGFAPPLTLLDREADMRAAYAEFQDRLAGRS